MRWLCMAALLACSSPSTDDDPAGPDASADRDAGSKDATVIDPVELDDEFDDPSTLSRWTQLDSTLHQVLDIHTTTPGKLTMVPRANAAWFEDDKGPFLYKTIGGNFSVRTAVVAGTTQNPEGVPSQQFNSAGFVARDPTSQPGGSENWLMLNFGFQDGRIGSEGKTTVDSRSTLFITDGSHRGELILCRIGPTFVMLRKLDGESAFTETNRFERPDLPTELQVGVVANGYGASPDLFATFEYVRFETPSTEADCE